MGSVIRLNALASSSPCPPVAIVLVSWNSWRHTIECLDSVLGQAYPSFHLFVVDNDSSDDSVEHIAGWCACPRAESEWVRHTGVNRYTDRATGRAIGMRLFDRPTGILPAPSDGCRVTLIRSGSNLGFAGGCNVAMRAAGLDAFKYFWFLNTDTVIEQNALSALVRRAEQGSRIGMVGSTLRYYDRPQIVQAMGGAHADFSRGHSRHIGEGVHVGAVPEDGSTLETRLTYIFGASMLVSSRFVREIGPMQEDYFLYYEEIDWALRGRERFKLGYAADSHVFHKSGATSSKVRPTFTTRLYYRNRIRFIGRFFPQHLGTARRGMVGELVRFTLKGQWGAAGIVASVLWNARRIALGRDRIETISSR